MKRILSVLAAGSLLSLNALAADLWHPEINISMDARADYQYGWVGDKTDDDFSGFKGKYLDLMIDGQINDHFSYSLRQRLNKTIKEGFDATDWVNITYHPTTQWEITAGKEVVGIGGYEYDRAPINLFTCSEFWNNIPCYQFGVSGAYKLKNGKDKFMLQITRNPFAAQIGNNNTYAYNAMWYGNHGFYSSIWSVNLVEYRKGHYISYIALGNKFDYRNVSLELDLMNRATSHQTFFFKDFSMMAELSWVPEKHWKVFAKATYDVNHSGRDADYCVYDGTELWLLGGGVEYFPLRTAKHDIRLHATYFHSHGKNGNPDGTMRDNTNMIDVGVTWRFDILKYSK